MWDLNPALTAEPKLRPCSWLATKDIPGPVCPLHISISPSGQLCHRLTPLPAIPWDWSWPDLRGLD